MTDRPRIFTDPGRRQVDGLPPQPHKLSGVLGPEGYLPSPELVDAVNVALALSQPLLVTGEPGTGKTQLAYAVAHDLGLELLRFDTKSNSRGRDLLYTYDALARLHRAQIGQDIDPFLFISFGALGQAILRASDPGTLSKLGVHGFQDPTPRRSVVLIDEIDNAPREFANDLLSEIESFRFSVAEAPGLTVAAPAELAPVIVVTSNSERNLPDAFLRRCVYVHIPFPDLEALARIVEIRLGERRGTPFLESALRLFLRLRQPDTGLRKIPATAELLGWLRVLRVFGAHDGMRLDVPTGDQQRLVESTLSALFKTPEDLLSAHAIVRELQARLGDAWRR